MEKDNCSQSWRWKSPTAVTTCPDLATALQEIRNEPSMEQTGEEGTQTDDWKRWSEEELGWTGLVCSRNEKHAGAPAGQAAEGGLVSLPTATWKSRNRHNWACWGTGRGQNTWEWLRGAGIVFFDGHICCGRTVWPDHRTGKGDRWLPKGSSSSSSSLDLITLGINSGSHLRRHLPSGPMQWLNHKPSPVLTAPL